MTIKDLNTLLRRASQVLHPFSITLFGNGFRGNPNHLFAMKDDNGKKIYIAYLVKKLDGFDFNQSIKFGNLDEVCLLTEGQALLSFKEILRSEAKKFIDNLSNPEKIKAAVEARMAKMKESTPLFQ